MNSIYTTKTAEETEKLAERLLLDVLAKKTVLLSGPLGSGKTTFVKGLAKALGIQELIKSPTYTYINSYELASGDFEVLHHFDLYRLPEVSENPEHVKASIGLEDALNNPHALVVIEWPERLPIEGAFLKLEFERHRDGHHVVKMKN